MKNILVFILIIAVGYGLGTFGKSMFAGMNSSDEPKEQALEELLGPKKEMSEEDKKKPKKKEKKMSLADRVEKLEKAGKKKAGDKKKVKPTPMFGDKFDPDD